MTANANRRLLQRNMPLSIADQVNPTTEEAGQA
jgi:hypothetical protein